MKRLQRQWPFLTFVLKEANRQKRQERLQHANSDQINAISELVLNVLKNNIPLEPKVVKQLRQYKQVLRQVGARRHSVKKRRGWLM